MNSRFLWLVPFALLGTEVCAQSSYVSLDTAFIEPAQGLIKSLYKSNIYSLGLGYGRRLESGGTLEVGLARRAYESRLNAIESNIEFYELETGAFYPLFKMSSDLDFIVGARAKIVLIQSQIENEDTDRKADPRNIFSFGYDFAMGLNWKVWGLENSHLRFTIAQEHIYKSVFADVGLDSHIYGLAWQQTLP